MKFPIHRIAVVLCSVAAVAGALAVAASAKEGFRATLTSPFPADAKPGSTITVSWKVANRAGDAFNASSMFVRLRGPHGEANEGFAGTAAHTDGGYGARVTVPKDGTARIEIGVAGTATTASGSRRSDYLFPITNPPALGGAASDSGTPTLTWLLPLLGGLAAIAVVAFAFRRRATGQLQTRPG
jgi:hypothetical protein